MDPVLFTLFGIEIRWYSILILVGIILAIGMLIKEGKRFNIPKDFLFNMAFWTIIFGIIGARLYYCIFNFNLYKDNLIDILKIWEGGLAIHGGIIAGFITLLVYTKKYNVNTIKITDMTVVPLLLAQAIGRWGNFFNKEAHGGITTLTNLKNLYLPDFIIEGMYINGNYYIPTFLYESLWCILGFIILIILRNKIKYKKEGIIVCSYFIFYSLGRFFIEGLRTDSLYLFNIRISQLVSILLFVIGIIGIILINRKGDKHEKS